MNKIMTIMICGLIALIQTSTVLASNSSEFCLASYRSKAFGPEWFSVQCGKTDVFTVDSNTSIFHPRRYEENKDALDKAMSIRGYDEVGAYGTLIDYSNSPNYYVFQKRTSSPKPEKPTLSCMVSLTELNHPIRCSDGVLITLGDSNLSTLTTYMSAQGYGGYEKLYSDRFTYYWFKK